MGLSTKVSHLISGGTRFPIFPYQGQSLPEWTALVAIFYDLLDRRGLRQTIEAVRGEDWFRELETNMLLDIRSLSPVLAMVNILDKLDTHVRGFHSEWSNIDEETKAEITDVGTSIIARINHDPDVLPDVRKLYQHELKVQIFEKLDQVCREPSPDWMLDADGQVPMAIYRAMKRGASATLEVLESKDYTLTPYTSLDVQPIDILAGITDLFNDISS